MTDNRDYRRHHYVPQWYQRGFIPDDAPFRELFRLDTRARAIRTSGGRKIDVPPVKRKGPKHFFFVEDLYTTRIGDNESVDLEKRFFGEVDTRGCEATDFFADYDFSRYYDGVLDDFITFLSSQKLRTPKGLDWLVGELDEVDRRGVLGRLESLRSIYGAIWSECVWQIADTRGNDVGFIFSDHPVTVFNRSLAPGNPKCRGTRDPDIRCHGTHTIFPLNASSVLILTNRTWACDPTLPATSLRPYPKLDRPAIFNFLDVHTGRILADQEVHAINWIIKKRANQFVAAGREEWLFPEEYGPFNWRSIGNEHLLMPDPRELTPNFETVMAFGDGSVSTGDAFGRPSGHPDFGLERTDERAWERHRIWCERFEREVGPAKRGYARERDRMKTSR